MSFTSTAFLLALLPSALIGWALPRAFKAPWLLLCSLAFYATWSVPYLLLLLGVSAFVYAMARVLDRHGDTPLAGRLLLLGQAILLGGLAVFKYPDLLSEALAPTGWGGTLARIIAPIGISYYLFKAISYLTDVYWGEYPAQRDPVKVALYLAFFPQIVSGPIQRAQPFFEQLDDEHFCQRDWRRLRSALALLVLGYFEKLIVADHIGPLVEAINQVPYPAPSLALAADYAYALQLFSDFAGVTHIALGLGTLFGIFGPANFNRPFSAMNIQDYWRRWHMSLSSWLADYLFTPLRMALRRFGTAGLCASLMINMVLIGVWHGSNATYFVFGVIHGVFLIVSTLTLPPRDRFFKRHPQWVGLRRVAAPVITFHLVVSALIFFRAPDVSFAWTNLRALLGVGTGPVTGWEAIDRGIWMPALAYSLIALQRATGWPALHRLVPPSGWLRRPVLQQSFYWFLALVTIFLAAPEPSSFIYARY